MIITRSCQCVKLQDLGEGIIIVVILVVIVIFTGENKVKCYFVGLYNNNKGSYHNSKPVKVGKPSHGLGGGVSDFTLVFPT